MVLRKLQPQGPFPVKEPTVGVGWKFHLGERFCWSFGRGHNGACSQSNAFSVPLPRFRGRSGVGRPYRPGHPALQCGHAQGDNEMGKATEGVLVTGPTCTGILALAGTLDAGQRL